MKQLSNHLKLITIKTFLSAFVFTLLPVSAEEVNVYSHRHYESDDKLFKEFTKNTGIKVNIVKASADALIERIKAEGKQSPADILITADAGRLVRAQDAGLLQTASSPSLNKQVPKHMRDKDGHWYGFTVRSRVLIYSKERINPSRLSTYEDLADPKWKGKLCLRTSKKVYNRSLIASMIDAYGYDKTKKVVSGWVSNLATEVFSNDTNALKAVSSGQCGVTIVNTYYLARLLDDPSYSNLKIFWANQHDRGVHVNISGAGVVKSSKNKINAVKLLEYLSSVDAQNFYASANKEYPVVENVVIDESIKDWGAFIEDDINVAKLGELQKEAVFLAQEVGYK